MNDRYNAFEVIEIAEQVERNAVEFYTRAAQLFEDPKLKNLLSHLAEWEKKHEEIFAQVKAQVREEIDLLGSFDPDKYFSSNPQIMASLARSVFPTEPAGGLTGTEDRARILQVALQKEKDTVVFYKGLKRFLRERSARYRISEIIEEEKRHIRILKEALQQN